MSKAPLNSGSAFALKAWIVPGAVTCVLAAAVISYPRAVEIHAAAGSPYYSKAAQEALAGLRSAETNQAAPAGAPALPAGLSADEHDWCEQCKTYHKRQPAGAAPQAGAAAIPAAAVPAAAVSGPIPPLPQGLDAAEYYWCANCKVYHSHKDPNLKVPGVGAAAPALTEPLPGIPPSLARPVEPPPSQE